MKAGINRAAMHTLSKYLVAAINLYLAAFVRLSNLGIKSLLFAKLNLYSVYPSGSVYLLKRINKNINKKVKVSK